ncbi:hypothetical protein BLOT_002602 [Blomia tropicalis]|nr:hypothetical protein BLOT_002602 [Blomia tropicalis]
MILYLIGIVLLFVALLATIGGALVYFGIFDKVEVSTGAPPFEFAGAEIAYKFGKGKPADSGALFTEVCSIVPARTTVGLYLELEDPDPENPTAERKTKFSAFSPDFNPSTDECHFIVGVITRNPNVDENDRYQTIKDNERQLLIEKGYKFAHLSSSENVVFSKFPFRGIVSVVIGIRRVYPALMQYIFERRLCAYPAMEIYHRDTIYYILPLSQQSQFVSLFEPPVSIEGGDSSDAETEIENIPEDSTSTQSTSSFEEI